MARPCKQRYIGKLPDTATFKPQGVPVARIDLLLLSLDELEALRLADLQGDLHEAAAAKMNVSRATFGRILEKAHKTVADALIHGKALRISGGVVQASPRSHVQCRRCRRAWEIPAPVVQKFRCPQCTGTGHRKLHGVRGLPRRHNEKG